MEELRHSLDQTRLRCLILEADKDAEIAAKEVEKMRASRYRSLLAKLAGEEDIPAIAADRPQASGLDLVPWDGSADSASRTLSSYFARNRLAVAEPQPDAQPAATITELQAAIDSEVSCPASSTGTRASPRNDRNLNSASHGESESDQNVVRASSSRSTQQTARPMTDDQRSAAQITIRVPSSSASSRQGDTRGTIHDTSMVEIFTRAGVLPFELTRDEGVRAYETRGVSRLTFSKKFGGSWRSEWPKCTRIPGYRKFLCADLAQPFVPTAPGKPGLVFRLPTVVSTTREDDETFHVFLSRGSLLYYQGEYAKSHRVRVEFDWNDLSHDCRHIWLKRMAKSGAVYRTLRARILLRNMFKREPNSTEVLEYLLGRSNDTLPYTVISAAFRAGEEKLVCEAIECIAYDSNLATIIQRNA